MMMMMMFFTSPSSKSDFLKGSYRVSFFRGFEKSVPLNKILNYTITIFDDDDDFYYWSGRSPKRPVLLEVTIAAD